jgi:hypothetical protein
LGLLVELIPDIVEQCRFGDLGKGLRLGLKPASEVKQMVGVGPQRARRELTEMLGGEKLVGPGDLVVRLVV